MDAFAISVTTVSIAVPLRAFVRRSWAMRLEPAVMTDDPDLRILDEHRSLLFSVISRIMYPRPPERGALNILSPTSACNPVPCRRVGGTETRQGSCMSPHRASPSRRFRRGRVMSIFGYRAPLCMVWLSMVAQPSLLPPHRLCGDGRLLVASGLLRPRALLLCGCAPPRGGRFATTRGYCVTELSRRTQDTLIPVGFCGVALVEPARRRRNAALMFASASACLRMRSTSLVLT